MSGFRSQNYLGEKGLENDAVLDIDWRVGSDVQGIMEKIVALLQNLANTSDDSTAKILKYDTNCASLETFNTRGELDVNGSIPRWVQAREFAHKRLDNPQGRGFFQRLVTIAKRVLHRLDEDTGDMNRSWKYLLTNTDKARPYGITRVQAQGTLEHLALQIEEHPWALGVVPAPKGRFMLPPGWTLEHGHVTDILKWRSKMSVEPTKRLGYNRRKCTEPGVQNVPALIHDLTLFKRAERTAKLRGIVVTEHTSALGTLADKNTAKRLFGDILWIGTHGCPDHHTQEFLRLVVETGKVDPLDVVWVSDHDPTAFKMFLVLKMGSMNCAWASKILSCPAIRWKGPTVNDLRSIFNNWPESELRRQQYSNPTEEQRARERLEGKRDQILTKVLSGPDAKLTGNRKAMLNHFQREHKWDLLQWDQDLAAEVAEMKRDGDKVARLDKCTLEMFMAPALNQWLTQVHTVPEVELSALAMPVAAVGTVVAPEAAGEVGLEHLMHSLQFDVV
ncbi:MAG: hypothetical protein Q9227_008937 [Pyrenula ochraceoflavens]